MLTLALAVSLSLLCVGAALQRLAHLRQIREPAEAELDELERRLSQREADLYLALSRRIVRALSRVSLAAGTGLALFQLTHGAGRLPWAVATFVAGVAGWLACQEVLRRIGSSAGSVRKLRASQGVDP